MSLPTRVTRSLVDPVESMSRDVDALMRTFFGRSELVLNRLTPFVEGGWARIHQQNLEIDSLDERRTASVSVGISPLTVVLGILIGAILYGLPGAFLAVPIAGAIQVIVAHAVGLEDPGQVSESAPAVIREAAAQAAAGAAASAPAGEEGEAASEAAREALKGATPDPTRAAQAAERAVLAATGGPPDRD